MSTVEDKPTAKQEQKPDPDFGYDVAEAKKRLTQSFKSYGISIEEGGTEQTKEGSVASFPTSIPNMQVSATYDNANSKVTSVVVMGKIDTDNEKSSFINLFACINAVIEALNPKMSEKEVAELVKAKVQTPDNPDENGLLHTEFTHKGITYRYTLIPATAGAVFDAEPEQ